MFTDYFRLAFRNLKKRGLRSYLTMLGIFLGIAAVVSLISLGNGLQDAVTGQFNTLDADKLLIQNTGTGFGPPGATAVRKLTKKDLDIIKSTSGVEFTITRLIRVVTVDFNRISNFKTVASIPQDKEEIEIVYDALNADIDLGRHLESTDRGKVVLGQGLIEDFDKEIKLGTNLEIQGETFQVIGILEESGNFFINEAILMAEEDMERILKIEDEIDVIVVQVSDPDRIESVVHEIERKLRKDRNQKLGEEDFSVQTPLQSIDAVNTVLNIINIIVVGIAAISLLIGGIGIANTMYTSVLERTKEIGIMKSIGATNTAILSIFMLESALLGLVGGIIGAAIGLALAFAASGLASSALGGINLGVSFSFPLVFASISFSLLIGVISGILPAYQASKLNPVEALRK